MSHVHLEQIFLWTAVLSYALLILWWILMRLPHAWLYNLSGKPFKMSEDTFDACNLVGIGLYKIAILAFFVIPYAAMRIVGP